MRQLIEIPCRYCPSHDLVKNGHSETGAQRYRCKSCRRTFQLTYRYNAWNAGTKEHIDEMTLNSSGVRDIARTLQISPNTVVAHLKESDLRT
ncbi:MAG TPA: IS1-like element transposase [Chloroflexota bacterium]|nr:IS1-like element transposase [Chloroflexota bacterium]